MDPRRVVDFSVSSAFSLLLGQSDTSKLLTSGTRNEIANQIFMARIAHLFFL